MERQESSEDIAPALAAGGLVLAGYLVKDIGDPLRKQWTSSILGVLVVLCLCRWSVWHPLVMVLGNAVIIIYGSKRHCFSVSFFFTFAHLLCFYLDAYLSNRRPHVFVMGILMALVWKMIHLSGEVQDEHLADKPDERMKVYSRLTLGDFLHYSCCHAGAAVFFRYRTYYDWLHFPLHPFARGRRQIRRMVVLGAKMAAFIALTEPFFPIEYLVSDSFRHEAFAYKYAYTFYGAVRVLVVVAGMFMLAEMHCVMAGMGAYPTLTNPRPGVGPTARLELLDEIAGDPVKARSLDYNFVTSNYVVVEAVLASTDFQQFWRNYNRVSKYVLVENVYKRFPIESLRWIMTFVVTTMWHEITFYRYAVSLFALSGYTLMELLWRSQLKRWGASPATVDLLLRASALVSAPHIHLSILYLESADRVHRYYSAVHYAPFVYTLAMIALALALRLVSTAQTR